LTFDARRNTLIPEGFNVPQKPTRQSDPAKEQGEFGNFDRLLGRLLRVPHSKIKAELEAEKRLKPKQRKRASVGHAYRDTD
jgi:hypothetical protein